MRDGLTPRLASCAAFVRQDAVFADIGTDHAYLPIFLLKEGIITKGICSDINEGPLSKAKENAEANGLLDRLEFLLCDGAAELSDFGATDYAICGMGGELIAEIISRAPHLKNESLNLILQPMTRQAHLRQFLSSEGFDILFESYSAEGEKMYVSFLVKYTGKKRKMDIAEAEICAKNAKIVNKDLQLSYIKAKIRAYEQMIDGKKRGNVDFATEEMICSEMKAYIK